MKYYSTNHKTSSVELSEAVTRGLAPDGGLFMPERIAQLPQVFFDNLADMSFVEMSQRVARALLPGVSSEIINRITAETLAFDTPIHKVEDRIYSLELFHGPTLAFKDVGARFMARLLAHFAKKDGRTLNVLVATSGDTGSAVANGFLGVEGINVYVLYPKGKVSRVQESQFTTLGKNITAIEIDGTFDDCQKLVKQAFVDNELNAAMRLTSANSINIARLLPQSFYYFRALAQLKSQGIDKNIVVCVPSGNFGNCLAGWMAREMGVPARRFIVASNPNDILTDFFRTGVYDARREFFKTCAPAMDILVSSNMERLLWYMSGKDGDRVRSLMEDLRIDGCYKVDGDMLDRIRERFRAGFLSEEEIKETIGACYREHSYLLDTHTACGYGVLERLRREEKKT